MQFPLNCYRPFCIFQCISYQPRKLSWREFEPPDWVQGKTMFILYVSPYQIELDTGLHFFSELNMIK
jgi:hypothetical protein